MQRHSQQMSSAPKSMAEQSMSHSTQEPISSVISHPIHFSKSGQLLGDPSDSTHHTVFEVCECQGLLAAV